MYKIWFARNYRTYMANTLLLDNALATMGAGLPSAMMAKLLYPKRRVMAVCGDGGFMMNSQELETAVRLRLDLVVLILDDSSYGMIRWKQAVDDFPDFGMTFGNPDFVQVCRVLWSEGLARGSVGELDADAGGWLPGGGVHLVACRSTTPRTRASSSRNSETARRRSSRRSKACAASVREPFGGTP